MTDQTMVARRVTQLDGLRGIAALVVLFHHTLLTIPSLALGYQSPSKVPSSAAWLVFSPLHTLWNGNSAVYVFFVLSGFVLVVPLSRRRPDWRSYYPRRLIRLYLPVWGSVAIACVLILTIPRVAGHEQSWWVNSQVIRLIPHDIVQTIVLLFGANLINSPLWSLQWEIWFSLLLPVFFLLATKWSRGWLVKLAALAVISTIGSVVHIDALFYLPMFGFGAILAVEWHRLHRMTTNWGWVRWLMPAVLSVLMLNSAWDIRASIPGNGEIAALGAILLVIVFLFSPVAQRIGDSRAAQWLGRISFSLYLVHVPILVSLTFLVRNPAISAPVAIVVCLTAGQIFYWVVERPAHRLSHAVGRKLARPTISEGVSTTS